MIALVLALLLASPALDRAKAGLRDGKLDEVAKSLEAPDSVPLEENADAIGVLLDSATVAKAHKDSALATYLAGLALKRDTKSDRALRMLAEWSRDEHEWELALGYSRRRVEAHPESAEAKLSLERMEAAAKTDDEPLKAFKKPQQQASAKPQSEAKGTPVTGGPIAHPQTAKVAVYGAENCGPCRSARNWLTAKGVAFDDYDVEKDPGAAKALAEKEKAKGQARTTLPVIEIDGKLLAAGFSTGALQSMLLVK